MKELSSVIYNQDLKGRPGLHVLLIGVSEYPYLSAIKTEPNDDDGFPDFGLRPVSGPAYSISKLANWIVQHKDDFSLPLASCRALVSAVPSEVESEPALATYALADLSNARRATREWRAAAQHPDSQTLFYFAGHGIQRTHLESVKDQVLLLHGFGDPETNALSGGFSANDIIDAMAPGSSENTKVARSQYFVFDACRNTRPALEKYGRTATDLLLDIDKAAPDDDRQLMIIRTTAPGRRAFSHKNGLTYFAKAVLKCLDGGVGELPRGVDLSQSLQWNVTLGSLEQGVGVYLDADSRANTVPQQAQFTGSMRRDTVICRLKEVPEFLVKVRVDPATAAEQASITFLDPDQKVAWALPTPVAPHPHWGSLRAGIYCYKTAFKAPIGQAEKTSRLFSLMRPGDEFRVSPLT